MKPQPEPFTEGFKEGFHITVPGTPFSSCVEQQQLNSNSTQLNSNSPTWVTYLNQPTTDLWSPAVVTKSKIDEEATRAKPTLGLGSQP